MAPSPPWFVRRTEVHPAGGVIAGWLDAPLRPMPSAATNWSPGCTPAGGTRRSDVVDSDPHFCTDAGPRAVIVAVAATTDGGEPSVAATTPSTTTAAARTARVRRDPIIAMSSGYHA